MLSDYEKIFNIIRKKGIEMYDKEIHDYHKSSYAVVNDNSISINSHIDLEVARTDFKFDTNGKLIDISVWGWY